MQNNAHRFLLHLLLIAALFGGAVSPACKFVRGEISLIEICTPDGLKTVPAERPAPHKPGKECPFCLAHHKMKSVKVGAETVTLASFSYPAPPPQRLSTLPPDIYRALDYAPRGPPVLS